jgi:hypothetical protein
MTAGLSDIRPPSIHAVSTDQVTPAGLVGMIVIVFFDLGYQGRYILCVIENRHPNASLVSRDAFETFEHFKVADANASDWPKVFGKERAPNAMGMEDGPRPTASS